MLYFCVSEMGAKDGKRYLQRSIMVLVWNSVLEWHLIDLYCYDKNTATKSNSGKERFIWLKGHNSSWRKSRWELKAGPEDRNWTRRSLLIAFLFSLGSFYLLGGTTRPGMPCPQCTRLSHINHYPIKCPIGLPTGQYNSYFLKWGFSEMTLASVKLWKERNKEMKEERKKERKNFIS